MLFWGRWGGQDKGGGWWDRWGGGRGTLGRGRGRLGGENRAGGDERLPHESKSLQKMTVSDKGGVELPVEAASGGWVRQGREEGEAGSL